MSDLGLAIGKCVHNCRNWHILAVTPCDFPGLPKKKMGRERCNRKDRFDARKLVKRKEQRTEEVTAQAEGIEDAIAQLDLSIPPLEDAASVASSRVATAVSRIEYLAKINVESLADQEASEASHKSTKVSKEAELAELNKAGGDVATRKIARNQEIKSEYNNELGRISTALV